MNKIVNIKSPGFPPLEKFVWEYFQSVENKSQACFSIMLGFEGGPWPFSILRNRLSSNYEDCYCAALRDGLARVVRISRESFNEIKEGNELDTDGIYILDDGCQIYIGQSGDLRERITNHKCGSKFWEWAILITANDVPLDKEFRRYLESQLTKIARQSGRRVVKNEKDEPEPFLDSLEREFAECFLKDILFTLPSVGFDGCILNQLQ
jgi:hypothetical protein